jgi:hypothetical protein
LDYIIAKKQSKKIKSGVDGIPFASAVSTVGFKMKGAWKMAKGTRGKGREAAASDLIGAANGGGPSAAGARLSIMELVDWRSTSRSCWGAPPVPPSWCARWRLPS